MPLIDVHEKGIETIIVAHGTTITLTDPEGENFSDVKCIFNGVDHGINIESISDDPMVSKTNVYILLKELESKGINIDKEGWFVTGKSGKYEPLQVFLAEAPKRDKYVPGVILFLSIINPDAQDWGSKVV